MTTAVPSSADVVVIGASLAGLFAAAAAAGSGRSVVLLERDDLPDEAVPRPGVPQGRQPHVLLHRGLLAMGELLPGIRTDLVAAGGVPVDTGMLAWLDPRGWSVHEPGLEVVSATRPLVEHVVRQRVLALPGVRIVDRSRVRSVARTAGAWSVTVLGQDGESRWHTGIVVDASGRSSRLPVWLEELHVRPATVTELDAGVGYASRRYQGGPDPRELAGVVVAATPGSPRGGLALPVEGGGWLIGAVGLGEHRPPRDAAGFDDFLHAMRDPVLADLAAGADSAGPVAVHRQTENRRRAYHLVPHWPDDLVPLGDSFCAFNPVYGQDITVAAREAVLLHRSLSSDSRPGRTSRLLRDFAVETLLPWSMATGADAQLAGTAERLGPMSGVQAALRWWVGEVARLAVHGDRRAGRAINRTFHLMGSPLDLLHPALAANALRTRLIGAPANPRPAAVRALATP
ncbi:NAD(P)/FAD-dependent oxidoreductase [Nakamurella leprariae]|uniref:FAD-dependent oxidoreductase n=1 Tax=Nakamurella leprariae TaxID=2803911 RepID=A0A938Y968_9ACTN|nr:FAD-dependent oxidoreductase [Nakamurella leprariae]MBM9468361.1 hypothetical protein [Nakamurella leprariae]